MKLNYSCIDRMGMVVAMQLTIVIILLIFNACDSSREFSSVTSSDSKVLLHLDESAKALASYSPSTIRRENEYKWGPRDEVDKPAKKRLYMNAVIEDGELVSVDTLQNVYITASYMNIPERMGFLDIPFTIEFPSTMVKDNWQIRLTPKLYYEGDSLRLDKVIVTGSQFKSQKLRGLEKYNQFLSSLVLDSEEYKIAFAYHRLLERFCRRNVDKNLYGVLREEAEEHYINRWLLRSNDAKVRKIGQMYRKWCEGFETEGNIRLDTIVKSGSKLIYQYTQRVKFRPRMKKILVAFEGEIASVTREQYTLPKSDTLCYTISSIAQFTNRDSIYIDKVIERRVVMESSAYLNFLLGDSKVIDTLANNCEELKKIFDLFYQVVNADEFLLDSIIMVANCSPEGSYALNEQLSNRRSQSVKEYFNLKLKDRILNNIPLISRNVAEDWEHLKEAILQDTLIKDKAYLIGSYKTQDLDKREKILSLSPDYQYIKENIYPKLRRIDILFSLHRKGMLKDTIHTKEPDYNYLKAIEALDVRDYQLAESYLKGYRCSNLAIALIGQDRIAEALSILNLTEENNATTNYLKALVYARLGRDDVALNSLDKAVEMDDNLIFRIKLDPEINALVARKNRIYTLRD